MDPSAQIEHLESDLDNLIERYVKEYDLPCAAIIGVLQMKQMKIFKQQSENLEGE